MSTLGAGQTIAGSHSHAHVVGFSTFGGVQAGTQSPWQSTVPLTHAQWNVVSQKRVQHSAFERQFEPASRHCLPWAPRAPAPAKTPPRAAAPSTFTA